MPARSRPIFIARMPRHHPRMNTLTIENDLTVSIGRQRVRLSPREGLAVAELLARKSFRRALAQEAEAEAARLDLAEIEELQ